MEALHRETEDKAAGKAKVLTLACYEAPDTVEAFMRQRNYSFAVAMADEATIKGYEVPGFPFKGLVTLEGRFMALRLSDDWQGLAHQYLLGEPPK